MSRTSNTLLAIALPIIILLVVAGAGMVALSALSPEPEKAEEAPRGLAIFTDPIELTDLQLTVRSQGEVRPFREVALASQITGRVRAVSPDFVDGGFVRGGEVLIYIEDDDFQLAKIRAQSQVASAQQALIQVEAEAEIARKDWEELGIGTPSPLALREPQLAEARAALDAASAQLAETELALRRTVVRAPFDGRIRSKSVDVGQFISPGQSLGNVFGTESAEMSLPLTDDELGRLGLSLAFEETAEKPGPVVKLSTNVGGKPRVWTGRVTRTAASVDPQTRLITAIATVPDPFGEGADGDAPLAPGLFVDAEIVGAIVPNVLWAPRAALREDDTIYVADPEESTMSLRTVDVIFSDREGVYISGGVEPGELAITSPIQAAFDGMSISIADLEDEEDNS